MFKGKSKEEIVNIFNSISKNTMIENMGIVITDFTGDTVTAKLPVTSKVHQPFGFLHGGASLALAETVGSLLSATSVDLEKYFVFGTQVNGYHVKAVQGGFVKAVAHFVNKGKTSQVIKIEIFADSGDLVCFVTMINRIVEKVDFA